MDFCLSQNEDIYMSGFSLEYYSSLSKKQHPAPAVGLS